jgi:16S rRNA (guanine527-N7)-methyltransferase
VILAEFTERLGERARCLRVEIPVGAYEPLWVYFELLARWNARVNLSSLPLEKPTDETLDRLFLEPIAAAGHVSPSKLSWIDVGSGGGSPAIPLKVVRPAAALTMVEATAKKAAFLREVVRELRLADATIRNERFEVLAQPLLAPSVDLITVRAVRLSPGALAGVRALLVAGGRLMVFGPQPDRSTLDRFEDHKTLRLFNTAELHVFS